LRRYTVEAPGSATASGSGATGGTATGSVYGADCEMQLAGPSGGSSANAAAALGDAGEDAEDEVEVEVNMPGDKRKREEDQKRELKAQLHAKHWVAHAALTSLGWNGTIKRGQPPPTPKAGSVLALLVARGGEYPAKKPSAVEALQSVMKLLDHQRVARGDVAGVTPGCTGGAGVVGEGAGEG